MRNTKKKALYEVIRGAGSRMGYEQLHSKGSEGESAGPSASLPSTALRTGRTEQQQGGDAVSPPNVVRWTKKPSVVQFNAGRIEFSIPYQLGIAVLLGVLLVLVVVFRLGERLGSREAAQITSAAGMSRKLKEQVAPATTAGKQAGEITPTTGVGANQPTGRNRIVIQIYQVRAHLEPAKEYFDKLGIATEIVERNDSHYLVTKNKYDNPNRAGTDGYLAKQKIIELGAGYKAPAGYETFGSKPFSDAFGMRFEE